MKTTLSIGAAGQLTTRVGPGNTITLGNDARATVFSTPSMIRLMEFAAREAMRPHLEPYEESVGVDVQIAHSAATPPKSEVTAEAIVTAVEKNVVSFDVFARDPWGEIGRGTHRRAVIQTSKFAARLAEQKPIQGTPSAEVDPTSNFKTIQCDCADGWLRLTLNRPRKRNAVSVEMTGEMEQLVHWLGHPNSSVRVVTVSGAEETFCTGDDVGDLPESTDEARELSLRRGAVYRRITELPQIFIASVDGLALGGGLVLAASCDFRIATHRAKLGLPEVLLGWPPNYGMGIIQSLVGPGRARGLALSGEAIDTRRAESIGLVDQVVSPQQLDGAVTRIAELFLSSSPDAVAATKRLLAPGREWCDERASDEFAACLETDHAKNSIAKFRK